MQLTLLLLLQTSPRHLDRLTPHTWHHWRRLLLLKQQILKDWLLLQCQHLQDSLPQHFQLTERLSLLNLQIEQHQ
ncbi:hypothetical protein PY73_14450 [Lacticaseibacillus rhamnosus]|nr:hypothetical protein PY73_14450 [Lacticaseibacillus rhamnosus]